MRTVAGGARVTCVLLWMAIEAGAQGLAGALAVDQRGDGYGWRLNYETPEAAGAAALRECGPGCGVVLTFDRCAAYAVDRNGNGVVGWGESYRAVERAAEAAVVECVSHGGTGCEVRIQGCNAHVTEEALALDGRARQRIQQELRAAGFEDAMSDGVFGSSTRDGIRRWQTSRGRRATGYLTGPEVEGLLGDRAMSPRAQATQEQETVFWQSIMDSGDPVEFDAYLAQFPDGVFRTLAEARRAGLRGGSRTLSGDNRRSGDDHGDTREGATWVATLGLPTSGELEVEYDTDMFVFDVPTAGTLTAETWGETDTMGVVTCGSGPVLTDDDGGEGLNFRIQGEVAARQCFVAVSGFAGETGSYTLYVVMLEGRRLADDDHGDVVEEASQLDLGTPTPGALEGPYDSDVFRLSIPEAGRLRVETTGDTDTIGFLSADCGGEGGAGDDDGGVDRNFRIQEEVVEGECFVTVRGFGGAMGNYILRAVLES